VLNILPKNNLAGQQHSYSKTKACSTIKPATTNSTIAESAKYFSGL
jgi:hypothetical protein